VAERLVRVESPRSSSNEERSANAADLDGPGVCL
jgi:hypothetical protein